MKKVVAIVVTFNRKELLLQAIELLLSQSYPLQKIVIVDNDSNDGTKEEVNKYYSNHKQITYLRLNENTGGAGGFYEGVKYVYEMGYDWIWLMDDDAMPTENSLEKLVNVANDNLTIYGSTAVQHNNLCWPVTLNNKQVATHINQLPPISSVSGIPFLGFFIHRDLIKLIGYPDREFFISGDDMEYCQRAIKIGKNVMLVRDSHIYHPLPPRITIFLFKRYFFFLKLAPWRRYYDIRNRIVLAKRHYGFRLFTATLPGILIRWIITLFIGENPLQQSIAYAKGIKDGLAGKLGRVW